MKHPTPQTETQLALLQVLLAEENPQVRRDFERLLANPSYSLVAASEEEALSLVENPAVAILIGSTALFDQVRGRRPELLHIPLSEELQRNPLLPTLIASQLRGYLLQRDNKRKEELIFGQHKAMEAARATRERDQLFGRRVHETLLTEKVPKDTSGLSLKLFALPSTEIAGDFVMFSQPQPHIFDLAMGDVMGKGVAAALIGSTVKAQLLRSTHAAGQGHLFDRQKGWRSELTPQEIVAQAERALTPQLRELEYFVSLFYARFDQKRRLLTYVDCGFAKPLHYRASSRSIEELKGENFPLGVVAENNLLSHEAELQTGDILVFSSDSIGQEVKALLKKNAFRSTEELLKRLKDTLLQRQREDDLFLIVVEVLEGGLPQERREALFASELSQAQALRDFVRSCCMEGRGDVARLAQLLILAANEAFSNIVQHAYRQSKRGEIQVFFEWEPEGVSVELRDRGDCFDPSRLPHPSLSGNQERGFGWYIIRELVDSVTYIPKEDEKGFNALKIFKKYLPEEERMDISHHTQEGVLVVTLEAEHLDAKEAPAFKEQILSLLTSEEIDRVVFDLHRLKFIDSSGLGAFLSILKALHGKGGELKLSNMTKTVRTVFELVCMHKIFEIFNNSEDALRSFKG